MSGAGKELFLGSDSLISRLIFSTIDCWEPINHILVIVFLDSNFSFMLKSWIATL